ncbi:MAG: phosphotransferase [Gemmatimonadetes bacterium]|nr:phosphotransferase [Gemmatimonadota bacterium]MBT5056726.1 phosphotransferase [Gemmatimonadota bacterium]MBT5960737.1 phosphotransferase [Gemmatimonadota bacterium]MBT7453658.1 phosphotransferase [Gemmatimonadota bacterium]
MTAFSFTHDGETRTYILRQPNDWSLSNIPDCVRDEYSRLGALHRGGLPVQAPVFCDETDRNFGRPGFVIEFVDGAPDLNPQDLSDYLDQFARRLSQIHSFDTHVPDLAVPVKRTRSFERFRDETPPQADPVYQVERIWKVLAASDWQSVNDQVLLHGDYWPGNILWRGGVLVAVIDWEEPEINDPLLDLAISRLDLWWVFGRQAMEDFTERYLALRPIDTTLLPAWDLRSALRPASNIEVWAAAYTPLERPDITADYMLKTHAGFVEQAMDALAH